MMDRILQYIGKGGDLMADTVYILNEESPLAKGTGTSVFLIEIHRI